MSANLAALCYLVAAALFILALRGLSNPETSRRGNFFGCARAVRELQDAEFEGSVTRVLE